MAGRNILPSGDLYTLNKNEVTTVHKQAVTVSEYCSWFPGPLINAAFCKNYANSTINGERNLYVVYAGNDDDEGGLVCAGIEEKFIVYTDVNYPPSPEFKDCHYNCMKADPDSNLMMLFPYYTWSFPIRNFTDKFMVMAGCDTNMGTLLLIICASIISTLL